MCGLVGFVNTTKDISGYRNVLSKMNNTISRRGPDEEGMYIEENVCLAHKRLIVIDPSGGKQPMICKKNSNTYTIVYNGQIYNTSELKEQLIESGFSFEGHSDTEILLKSYIKWGHDVVNKLNGIFSFVYAYNNSPQQYPLHYFHIYIFVL